MFTFEHLVIMEPSNVSSEMMETLKKTAKQITAYDTVPKDDTEILKRIQDADGILMSYTSSISREVLENCPKLHYIGLCCSLYSPESANVDMQAAKELGITVTGVREYGDNGVVEFALYEIIGLFHGYGKHIFESYAKEMNHRFGGYRQKNCACFAGVGGRCVLLQQKQKAGAGGKRDSIFAAA